MPATLKTKQAHKTRKETQTKTKKAAHKTPNTPRRAPRLT